MDDKKREIMNLVRSGSISAEEGAARLDALVAANEAPPVTAAGAAPAAPTSADQGTGRSVKVISQFGSAEVVADPTVATAIADGPHRVRYDGDAIVIEHVPFQEDDTFTFGAAGGVAPARAATSAPRGRSPWGGATLSPEGWPGNVSRSTASTGRGGAAS